MSGRSNDFENLIKSAVSQGFRFVPNKKHDALYAPDGHTIIGISHTPSDTNAMYQVKRELKKAGYMEVQTLGDALAPAMEAAAPKLSAMQYVIDYISRHPEGITGEDTVAFVRSKRPDVSKDGIMQCLYKLDKKGAAVRTLSGSYKLADRAKVPTDFRSPPGTKKIAEPKPPKEPKPKAEYIAGTRTGDPGIDEDLAALDGALAALARIETVVRKNREVLAQLATLKALLK